MNNRPWPPDHVGGGHEAPPTTDSRPTPSEGGMTSDYPRCEPTQLHARERGEAVRLVRRIQALLLELEELRWHQQRTPRLRAKERGLEQLHWQLAAVARRSASDLDAAA